jgi:hypothetical protein
VAARDVIEECEGEELYGNADEADEIELEPVGESAFHGSGSSL